MYIVFVHAGDVEIDSFPVYIHSLQSVVNDHCEFVNVCGVISNARRYRGCHDQTVAILMLETFPCERSSSGSAANQKSASTNIGCGPSKVADTLKTEHGIENIERHHWNIMVTICSAGGNP